jgi:hypothetical protein
MNGLTTASKRSPPPVLIDCLIETPERSSRIRWHVKSETAQVARPVVGTGAFGRVKQGTLSISCVAKGRRRQTRGIS